MGLAEVCIECSADDQPPHFTGPGSNLIQFGISKEAAHGEVVDVAVSACEADVGRERTELKAARKTARGSFPSFFRDWFLCI